jgi:NAD(P)-dependent dehydrogenase (short-subunit alcohol dehydrogenase family)
LVENAAMKCLQGKTALVSGGTRNLGLGMAMRLADSGALVAVNYASNEEAAAEAIAAITADGGQAFAVKARLGEPGANEALIEALDAELKRAAGHTRQQYRRGRLRHDCHHHARTIRPDLCQQRPFPLLPDTGALAAAQ